MASSDDNTVPTSAVIIATALTAALAGYWIGTVAMQGTHKKSWPNDYDIKVHPESSLEEDEGDESEEGQEQTPLNEFEGNTEEVKLVLVVRTDLGMGKGKIAAQCGHATLACYKQLASCFPPSRPSSLLRQWERHGQPKIALQVKTEDELLLLQAKAISLGLCAQVIQDAGRTQIASGSRTVLGVLGPKSVVDQVTGDLKLL